MSTTEQPKQDPAQAVFSALTRYARHHEGCGSRTFDPGHKCRCGFNRAYADALELATSYRPHRKEEAMVTEASWAVQNLREQLDRGPYEGEDFFRMQVTGNGKTKWVNISPAHLATIIEALESAQ